MMHWLPSCVSREGTLKAGCRRCIGFLSDGEGAVGGGLPVAGTAKGWSYLMHPSALHGLTGSRVFSARASSQPLELINGPPSLSHLDPPTPTQGRTPAPPLSHSTSSFRFSLPLFSQQAPPPLGGCVRPPEQGPGCMPDAPTHQWPLDHLLQSTWAGPLLASIRVP